MTRRARAILTSLVAPAAAMLVAAAGGEAGAGSRNAYPWRGAGAPHGTIASRIAAPPGYRRIAVAPGSFGHWLRHLPLKPVGAPVRLHTGGLKPAQFFHAAVVDIDTGRRDLQQCADAVMRLRAEYLFGRGRTRDIHFNFTSGDRADFTRWAKGWRPLVRGNRVRWRRSAAPASGHRALRDYLRVVFTYAGTYSLRKELRAVSDPRGMRIGDVFIQGGFPGHAVLVADMAKSPATGAKVFMLVQSYMPAQDIHVLKNLHHEGAGTDTRSSAGPWYPLDFGDRLNTPEWSFRAGDLRRFR